MVPRGTSAPGIPERERVAHLIGVDEMENHMVDALAAVKADPISEADKRLIAAHEGTVTGLINAADKAEKGTRKRLFGLFRACGNMASFETVCTAAEKAWRKAHECEVVDISTGERTKRLPALPGSYKSIKSQLVKTLNEAPALLLAVLEDRARMAATHAGTPALAEKYSTPIPGLLVPLSDRYDGDDVKAWNEDVSAAKKAEARNKANDIAPKVAASGGTAQGMSGGQGNSPGVLGPDAQSALEGFNADWTTILHRSGLSDKVLASLIRDVREFARMALADAKTAQEALGAVDADGGSDDVQQVA